VEENRKNSTVNTNIPQIEAIDSAVAGSSKREYPGGEPWGEKKNRTISGRLGFGSGYTNHGMVGVTPS